MACGRYTHLFKPRRNAVQAYECLSDPHGRAAYDKQLELALQDDADGYTGQPLSKWVPGVQPKMAKNKNPNETRAVFVDEQSCIGCKNCMWVAPATFRIEETWGRSRVFGQWLDSEDDLDTAILSCPVDCIHWVDKEELPALEFVCQQKQERVDVSVMQARPHASFFCCVVWVPAEAGACQRVGDAGTPSLTSG